MEDTDRPTHPLCRISKGAKTKKRKGIKAKIEENGKKKVKSFQVTCGPSNRNSTSTNDFETIPCQHTKMAANQSIVHWTLLILPTQLCLFLSLSLFAIVYFCADGIVWMREFDQWKLIDLSTVKCIMLSLKLKPQNGYTHTSRRIDSTLVHTEGAGNHIQKRIAPATATAWDWHKSKIKFRFTGVFCLLSRHVHLISNWITHCLMPILSTTIYILHTTCAHHSQCE